jgi:hypothetical protein
MKKSVLLGLLIAALALTAISSTTPMSFADRPDDPNRWGKEASRLAQADGADQGQGDHPGGESGSEMGEHARENDLDPGPGRVGVGNLDLEGPNLEGDGERDHPSESVDTLCDNFGCPPSD